jgi:hypothetical protein
MNQEETTTADLLQDAGERATRYLEEIGERAVAPPAEAI